MRGWGTRGGSDEREALFGVRCQAPVVVRQLRVVHELGAGVDPPVDGGALLASRGGGLVSDNVPAPHREETAWYEWPAWRPGTHGFYLVRLSPQLKIAPQYAIHHWNGDKQQWTSGEPQHFVAWSRLP